MGDDSHRIRHQLRPKFLQPYSSPPEVQQNVTFSCKGSSWLQAQSTQFRMSFSSPQVRYASHTVSTKAYAIEVMQENAATMLEILHALFRDSPTFVAYNLRRKFPGGYEKAIRYQTHLLQDTRVVILQNISSDMMFYLHAHIMSIPGVQKVLSSPKGHDIGRYSLLVNKDQFGTIRTILKNSLLEWVSMHVKRDAIPTEHQFPGPARVKPIYEEGMSSNENSWMTQSNASFMSIELPLDQEADFFQASMNANRIFTFDEFPTCAPSVHSTSSAPQQIIPPTIVHKPPAWTTAATSELTDTETMQQREIKRLTAERDTANNISNQIIAEQRAEIEALKAQRLADNMTRVKDAEEVKLAQTAEANKLRIELRTEMKIMMEQFMVSLTASPGNGKHGTSKRSSISSAEENNNHLSEKRRDDRTTPVKLFHNNVDPPDSNMETDDAMVADVSPHNIDHDL
jgi:hypothetical protein